MKTVSFELPSFWACALINGDETGMESEEIAAMNAWLHDNPEVGHCLTVSEEHYFMKYHDAHEYVLACDVSMFEFSLK